MLVVAFYWNGHLEERSCSDAIALGTTMPTDGRIRFETKEESNTRREREFLALTPSKRFMWFLRSFDERHDPNAKERPTKNFVIRKKGK